MNPLSFGAVASIAGSDEHARRDVVPIDFRIPYRRFATGPLSAGSRPAASHVRGSTAIEPSDNESVAAAA